jgi:hypothetical protein
MIDWITEEGKSFYQIQLKYELTISEVMRQYAQWRVLNVKD